MVGFHGTDCISDFPEASSGRDRGAIIRRIMPEAATLTPMFRQYKALKSDHPQAILLFRMGDFYEMFFEDAQEAARLLELTLTARGKGTANEAAMCGFPHHQLEAYTARLVKAGRRVAICDQMEDPRKTKGLVRREVVRVVSPGTVTDPDQLEAKANCWVGAFGIVASRAGAAFLDLSTGEFLTWQSEDDADPWDALASRLRSFAPRELIHAEDLEWRENFREREAAGVVLTAVDPYTLTPATAEERLTKHLGVTTLQGFGLRGRDAAVAAAGGLLQYAQETQKCGLEHINSLRLHSPGDALQLDPATRRNLELERSARDGGRTGSLFDTIDATRTPAGGRLLRRWLLAPLVDPAAIVKRQDAVAEWTRAGTLRAETRERLAGVRDIERLLTRAVAGTANARDLSGLKHSLERLPELRSSLSELTAELTRRTLDEVDLCPDLAELLAGALVDDPPASLRDGGFIREGHDAELDELHSIRRDGRSYIASLEKREREATGISSLKVKYNKVFGYFIEVSKSNLHLAPESYRRKQTIASGERFITPELKEYESKVLHAQERIESLELELFQRLRTRVASEAKRLQAVARATALLDVLSALAELAVTHDYTRPLINTGKRLAIVGGRHPVVERFLAANRFVANDAELEIGTRAIAILTGPNMGGKSTYLRQVALIVLLAQAGSFVPAASAEIGIVDRIFCRVGASDSLAEGQSTFMVEMSETANILHQATSRSLVLLDEIGRGTSTFDGLSIAWAVVEHLDALRGGAPRTLFATHYHELTELAVERKTVLNLRMAVREWGDNVVFMHLVEAGAADRSYGIQVARLAGVPQPVVARAKEILANLERDEYGRDGLPRLAKRRAGKPKETAQSNLFGWSVETAPRDPAEQEVLDEIAAAEPNRLTPLEALQQLSLWRERLGAKKTTPTSED